MIQQRRLEELDDVAARRGAVSVVVPPEHQGVVNALRTAFAPRTACLPPGFASLLDRLD